MKKQSLTLVRRTASIIVFLRNHKVILDADLAELYGVEVRHLNQQVKRNAERFPAEFSFRLTPREFKNLKSQNVISSARHGGRRYLPNAFTEYGAIMAATVLNSERAIEMSIFVVQAFVRMRAAVASNQRIVAKLAELEERLAGHDEEILDLVNTMHELLAPPPPNRRRIGFQTPSASAKVQGKLKPHAGRSVEAPAAVQGLIGSVKNGR